MLGFAYRCLTDLGAPVISLYLLKRRMEGREDKKRFSERLGHASQTRPDGHLIWCHAASVGEATSLFTLIERLQENHPATHILITTGTVTSARLLDGRLPPHVIHQYIPVDRAAYVKRFLDHWKPDFALMIESELWPNLLTALRERHIPAVLLNGRMSDKSFQNWYKYKSWAQEILSSFALVLTQTEDERARFVALGAKPARCFGNLKYSAKPLPCDQQHLTSLKQSLGGRPVWIMASTHRGEDDMAIETHQKLRARYPDLLTIIAPRHATRGEEIAKRLAELHIPYAQRSKQGELLPQTEIYLADTMGELGLFYRLCPIACVGGSFVNVGGHNLIEPAQLDCAIIFGPYMYNFAEMAKEFVRHQAGIQLQSGNEIAFTLERLLSNTNERLQFTISARALADQKRHVLDQTVDALEPWLKPNAKKAA
ncbi:MAG: 3-deoxy-D-manno-octulosonic acid transferase [Alphaproteobacteria bacterium]